jgi:HSP20 family protein
LPTVEWKDNKPAAHFEGAVMGQELEEAVNDLDQFERQVDRMLRGVMQHPHRSRPRTWRPPTDVYETDDAIIVKVEIAGMNPEDIQISFVDHLLTVHGVRPDVEAKNSYHCLEIPYGEFDSEVLLSGTFDEDAIDARYENGFLRIVLPKAKQEHRVPIHVQTQSNGTS